MNIRACIAIILFISAIGCNSFVPYKAGGDKPEDAGSLSDATFTARDYNNAGTRFYVSGQYKKALECFTRALD
ncbi:MAG: tetratricopeptide repeat protein, partial [Spirochaetales bacterium]|nr:tetratricopeptide repeat protein [Spirochaetales bacterium]